MTGQFMSTIFVPAGQDSGTICTHCRTDSAPASVTSTWFNAPVISLGAQANTITVASAAASAGVMTITFSATSATTIAEATANAVNITVLDDNNAVIPGTFAIGTSGSVSPTVIFTADDDTVTFDTVVVGAGVKDIYNVSVTPKVQTVA
jgi:hypothetical protein